MDWPYKESYVPDARYMPTTMSHHLNSKPTLVEKHYKLKQLEEREHNIKGLEKKFKDGVLSN